MDIVKFLERHPSLIYVIGFAILLLVVLVCILLIKKQLTVSEIKFWGFSMGFKDNPNKNLIPEKAVFNDFAINRIYQGSWTGDGKDFAFAPENLEALYTYHIKFDLTVSANSIQIEGNIKVYMEEKIKYSVRFTANGILHNGKACLTYMVQNESVFGYGVWNLHLNRNGSGTGYFVSSRVNNDHFGFGRLNITKEMI